MHRVSWDALLNDSEKKTYQNELQNYEATFLYQSFVLLWLRSVPKN